VKEESESEADEFHDYSNLEPWDDPMALEWWIAGKSSS
jgi:hypothetical protein